jgi:hypothetical protein
MRQEPVLVRLKGAGGVRLLLSPPPTTIQEFVMRMLSLIITFASAFAFAACEEPDTSTENALIEEDLAEKSLAKESLAKESLDEESEGEVSEDNGMDGLAPVTQDPSKMMADDGVDCCKMWTGDVGGCKNCCSKQGQNSACCG